MIKLKQWTIDECDTLYDNWGYFNNNKGIAEKTLNHTWAGIKAQAYRLGLGTRSNYLKSNSVILSKARDYLSGLVLGDGHIECKYNSKTGIYRQCCKHKCWLDKISEDLYEYGIECIVTNGQLRTGGFYPEGGSISYSLWTHSYVEFKEMHDRFYIKWYEIDKHPKRNWHLDENNEYFIWQKIVPEDICLSSECVANWYLGDGTIPKHTYRNGYFIRLSAEGYLREDIIFLSELLSETLDIKCGVTKVGKIQIGIQADISIFLNYIKDYKIPNCYRYKFPRNAM